MMERAMVPTLFVIASCDRCRAAIRWMRDQGHPFLIHDMRQDGLDSERLHKWLQYAGPDKILNRSSTTWRNLDPTQKASIDQSIDQGAIISLLLQYPTLIKRPILETHRGLTQGFDPIDYGRIL